MRGGNKERDEIIHKELHFLKLIQPHPNIIKYYGCSKIEPCEYHAILEYCKCNFNFFKFNFIIGSMLDYLRDFTKFPLDHLFIIKVIGQLTCAIKHLHNLKPIIIHRDLKV